MSFGPRMSRMSSSGAESAAAPLAAAVLLEGTVAAVSALAVLGGVADSRAIRPSTASQGRTRGFIRVGARGF